MSLKEVFDKVQQYSSLTTDIVSISEEAQLNNKIPKIVHFCYLDYRNMDEKHLNYLKSWFEILDDSWAFVNWTPEIKEPTCEFERFTIEKNKFAFYADYIRCSMVYEYGGVYMDCDVMLRRSFDVLLDFEYMFDVEYEFPYIECASFLAKKNNVFLGMLKGFYERDGIVDEYRNKHTDFIAPYFWKYNLSQHGVTIAERKTSDLGVYKDLVSSNDNRFLYTLDGTFLSCPPFAGKCTGKYCKVHENTFTRHGFEGTWMY